jgi:hypothetical protein
MAEVHLAPVPGTTVVFHSNGQSPSNPNAGKAVVVTGAGISKSVSGQVNAGSSTPGPIFSNPA